MIRSSESSHARNIIGECLLSMDSIYKRYMRAKLLSLWVGSGRTQCFFVAISFDNKDFTR